MITLSNNTKGLALLHQVEEIYGKVYTSDSLLETVLYWGINCTQKRVRQYIEKEKKDRERLLEKWLRPVVSHFLEQVLEK